MGPRTKLGFGLIAIWMAYTAALCLSGVVGQALALLTCTPMLGLSAVYVLMAIRFWRTRNPAWRP